MVNLKMRAWRQALAVLTASCSLGGCHAGMTNMGPPLPSPRLVVCPAEPVVKVDRSGLHLVGAQVLVTVQWSSPRLKVGLVKWRSEADAVLLVHPGRAAGEAPCVYLEGVAVGKAKVIMEYGHGGRLEIPVTVVE